MLPSAYVVIAGLEFKRAFIAKSLKGPQPAIKRLGSELYPSINTVIRIYQDFVHFPWKAGLPPY
jgi:hypothetical protein